MRLLFTTSDTLGSRLIRELTGEPVSHCAVGFYQELVAHATVGGVQIWSLESFLEESKIILSLDIPDDPSVVHSLVGAQGSGYDYPALAWLFLKKTIGMPGSINQWALRKDYLCTELLTKALLGSEDNTITPYQLYLKLKEIY